MTRDDSYLLMAFALAKQSYAIRKKVGCLIVDYSNKIPRVVADGVNGTLPGFPNECEYKQGTKAGTTKLSVVHAEHNALYKLNGVDANKCTMYVTTMPCVDCAKHIIMSGIIDRVVYYSGYKTADESIALLEEANIKVEKGDIDINDYEYDFSGHLRNAGHTEQEICDIVVGICLNS